MAELEPKSLSHFIKDTQVTKTNESSHAYYLFTTSCEPINAKFEGVCEVFPCYKIFITDFPGQVR